MPKARIKARLSAIDLLEKLLGHGVWIQNLPQWEKILEKDGVAAEELTGTLAKSGSAQPWPRQLRNGRRSSNSKLQF